MEKNKKILKIIIVILIIFIAINLALLGKEFIIKQKENAKYNNSLPKVYLEGKILQIMRKGQEPKIKLTYTEKGKEKFTTYAKIKFQGQSSIVYNKKNYTINLYQDENYKDKNKIEVKKEWGAQSKYCLKANYIDSTMARNVVSARLVGQMQKQYNLFENTPNNGAVDGFPVEIYVNGEYLGLYTWNIPKDEWMFNMDKKNENHIVMGDEEFEAGTSGTFEKLAEPINDDEWSIVAGPDKDEEQIKETFEKLNRVIAFVKDSTDSEFKEHFDEYLNLDACLNYYCFIHLCNGIDNMSKNMLLATYDGKIWYPVLYDLDSTWGLDIYGDKVYESNNKFPEQYIGNTNLLWKKLGENYKEEIKQRYKELRNSVLSDENIIKEFEKFNKSIPKGAWELEQEKWTNVPSKEYGLEQIKQYVKKRGEYVDNIYMK